MKLKKLFAGILAVAMMATMAAPAFADTVSFKAEPVTEIELTKNYTVKENMTAPAEKLAFELTYWKATDVATAGTDNDFSWGTKTYYADFTKDDVATLTGTNTAGIDIDVTQLGINKVGKYYFKVKEVAGSKPGVTYDHRTRVLLVSALNNVDEDGKLLTGLKFYAALYEFDEVTSEMGTKIEGSKAFDNSYDAYTINLSKEVRGGFADRNKEFTFNIVFTPATGKTSADYVGATVVKNGNTETWAIDSSVTHTVQLKHGDTFTINNLPEGVTYTITEDFDDANWTTTVGSVTTKEATGTVTKENTSVEYVNKNTETPDTGVILDNAPYIALMMIVVAGAAVMVIKKRRHYED